MLREFFTILSSGALNAERPLGMNAILRMFLIGWCFFLVSLALRLGMNPAGGGYAVQREEAIAHENGYQLIQ
jgi:hypothetical protein